MIFLLSLPIAIIAFLFESYPRFINRNYGVDVWTHLLYLKEYHKQKKIPDRIDKGFIVAGNYDYPPMFILILSRFPFQLVKKYEFLFSPFFDSLHVIIIFCIAFYLTNNLFISLIAQAIYVLTPIIVIENSSATPRSLGYTLFTGLFFSLFIFLNSGIYYVLIISVICGFLIFLTHRFTAQGFLFMSLFFSIINFNFFPFGVFLISFFTAVIFSKGFYLRVLKGHVGNLKFWKDNIKYRFAHQVRGNIDSKTTKDFVFKIYGQFLKFPPFVLQITNPWLLPVLYMLLFYYPSDYILNQMLWWVVASYLLALVTIWIPSFRFLGGGQRYLELSAFPTALLSAVFLFENMSISFYGLLPYFYVLVGFGSFLTIIVIQRKAIINEKMRTVTQSMRSIFNYLNLLKNKPRLLCIPHQITTSTIYHTGCPVFVNADYANINKISDVYPYIKKPIGRIMNEYDLDYILLNQNYATIEDLKLKNAKIVFQADNYLLIKPIL